MTGVQTCALPISAERARDALLPRQSAVDRVGEDEQRDDHGTDEEVSAREEPARCGDDAERAGEGHGVGADPGAEQHVHQRVEQPSDDGAKLGTDHTAYGSRDRPLSPVAGGERLRTVHKEALMSKAGKQAGPAPEPRVWLLYSLRATVA